MLGRKTHKYRITGDMRRKQKESNGKDIEEAQTTKMMVALSIPTILSSSDHSVQLLCEITMIHYHLINRTDQINYPTKYYTPLLSTSPSAKSFITSTFIWMNQPALTSIHPNFLKFIQLPFKEQKLEQEKRRQPLNHRGGNRFFSIKETAKTSRLSPPTHTSLHDPCTRWSEGHELRPGTAIRLIPSHIFSQAGNVNVQLACFK